MKWYWLWTALFLALACVLQTSVVPYLRLGSMVTLPLVVLIFLVIGDRTYPVRWFALFSGFILDLFSPFSFGLHIVSLLGAVLLSEMLFLNFFTNRSIYAMILLVIVGTITRGLLWFSGAFLLSLIDIKALQPSWSDISLLELLGNMAFGIILFYVSFSFRNFFGRYFFPRTSVRL